MKNILLLSFSLIFSFSYATVEILFPGIYLQKDFQGKNLQNKNWFGLFEEDNNFYVKKVNIKFQLSVAEDEEIFFTEEKVYYLEVEPKYPLIVLANIKNLQVGKITSCNLPIKDITLEKKMNLNLYDKSYSISISGNPNYDDKGQIKYIQNFQINFINDKNSQILFKNNKFKRSFISVILAGDLNSDKNMDLLLDISESYDEGRYILFLSSKNNEDFFFAKSSRT